MYKLLITIILIINFSCVKAEVNIGFRVGDWWNFSDFVESIITNDIFESFDSNDKAIIKKGLQWYEDSFLNDSLYLDSNKNNVNWVRPTTSIIPLYMAQHKDIPWWAPVTIEIEVQGLTDWFEVKFYNEHVNKDIRVAILYWQESAPYTKNYAETSNVLLGENLADKFVSTTIAPSVDYSGINPTQTNGYSKLELPPSNECRIIKLCITARPEKEPVILLQISDLNVRIKVYASYFW